MQSWSIIFSVLIIYSAGLTMSAEWTLKDLLGDTVQGKDGQTVAVNSFLEQGQYVGIYFSAHWCPPCRQFTPVLINFYNNLKVKHKDLEIVFVSSDRDADSFGQYYGEMPWLAVDFQDKKKLKETFGVTGIPMFVLINAGNNEILHKNARMKVMDDKEGDEYPWL